ncbi:MAG: DUF3617 family protein [Pontixanthobacter sp.]
MIRAFSNPAASKFTKAALAVGLATAFVWPATAQSPDLSILDRLTAGKWEIRDRDSRAVKRICLKNGRDFVQLRHPGQSCKRVAINNSAGQVTVQYTCRPNGYGRTSIRRETATLVQIEGQGITNKRHYEFTAEARRIGSC